MVRSLYRLTSTGLRFPTNDQSASLKSSLASAYPGLFQCRIGLLAEPNAGRGMVRGGAEGVDRGKQFLRTRGAIALFGFQSGAALATWWGCWWRYQ